MLWGSVIQLLTGLGLAAPLRDAEEPAPAKLETKLLIGLLDFVIVLFRSGTW